MSLRVRLAVIFCGMVVMCLVFTTFLSYREMVEEPADPDTAGEDREETPAWRMMEVVGRGSVPILLLAAGAWYLVLRMLRPIDGLTAAAERISSGRLDELGHPLPLTGRGDELDKLTAAFNRMSERLHQSFLQIHNFTLHASHELKTPLTVLRASLERELTNPEPREARPEILETRLDEIFRLTKIVDGLALLTRADADLVTLALEPVALHELVREVRDDLEVLADGKNLRISLHPCEEITLSADRHRLRQLLLILADNAVKYNVPNGEVHLSLKSTPTAAEFVIQNSGPHLSKDSAEHVFERFYRGDRSAGRTVDGCGLGLSIAQSLVELHRGKIYFTSGPELNTVKVTLPRASDTSEDIASALL
jgi:signal transduction histidine kinase